MNEIIKSILNHRSIRSYTNQDIKEEDLNLIIQCAQAAPSSINGQHVTIIVVKNKETKSELSRLAGNQIYIDEAPVFLVFCMDYNRAKIATDKNHAELAVTNSLEATLVGSIDVGLAMQNAINASESLGLGTVPIGGIRIQPNEVIKILELPRYVFPLCGLVIGYPKEPSATKPRLPIGAVMHQEKYNTQLNSLVEEYDEKMSQYMLQRTNGQSNRNWTQGIANYYQSKSIRPIREEMSQQGFKNE